MKEFSDEDIVVSNGKPFAALVEKSFLPNGVYSAVLSKRVFSLLQISFGDRDGLALQDYIETALMLQYNMR